MSETENRMVEKEEHGSKIVSIKIQNFMSIKDAFLEFDERKTKEAKFAKACDKFEADLQAYLYRNNFNYDKVNSEFYKDERIQEFISRGKTEVHQMFLDNDKKCFYGIFEDLSKCLEEMD